MKRTHYSGRIHETDIETAFTDMLAGVDSERGQLEDMQEQIFLLTKLVSELTTHLGEDVAIKLLNKHDCANTYKGE
jgi:hypothetical protein